MKMRQSSRSRTSGRPTGRTILGIAAGSTLLLTVLLVASGDALPAARAELDHRKPSTVPVTSGEDLPHAYLRLHAAGLLVTFNPSFALDWSYECLPVVVASIPRAGTQLTRGSVVSLRSRIPGCAYASPFTVAGIRPRRVPDFIDKRLTAAIHWTRRHHLFWAATIPRLRAGAASSLFANYTITAQRPRPGSTILPVVEDHRGARPTPLTLTIRP
jgi:hypothetical protein